MPKRDEVLKFLTDFYEKEGKYPTRKDIEKHFGVTRFNVYYHLHNLLTEGLIEEFYTTEEKNVKKIIRKTRIKPL